MYLIVGLGNPETEYSNTRHNMGFDVVNAISRKTGIEINKKNFKSSFRTSVKLEKKRLF